MLAQTDARQHAEILYRNAVTKARIISRRQLREFIRGDLDILPCSGDTERDCIKAALERMCAERSSDPTRGRRE